MSAVRLTFAAAPGVNIRIIRRPALPRFARFPDVKYLLTTGFAAGAGCNIGIEMTTHSVIVRSRGALSR